MSPSEFPFDFRIDISNWTLLSRGFTFAQANLPQKPRKNCKSQPVEELWQFGTGTGQIKKKAKRAATWLPQKNEENKKPKKKAEPEAES